MKCGRVLHLRVDADLIPGFFEFLQKGVAVEFSTGCSVKEFLCGRPGLSPDYVEQRIQTCFLDGKAVDDMSRARIPSGKGVGVAL